MKKLACLLLALAGCADGQVLLLFTSVKFVAPPNTCWKDATAGKGLTENFPQGGDWVLFQGKDTQWFLDIQDPSTFELADAPNITLQGVLEGKQSESDDSKFSFTGRSIRVDPKPNDTRTETHDISIELTVDDEVTGTLTIKAEQKCEGTNCPADFAAKNPNCTIAYPVIGVAHDIDNLGVAQ